VVNGVVIAGSAYDAVRRAALTDSTEDGAWQFADHVARELSAPEVAYVLDICEADDELYILELNPFSGADLFGCNRSAVVDAVSNLSSSIGGEAR
jgi:hypothetical protein